MFPFAPKRGRGVTAMEQVFFFGGCLFPGKVVLTNKEARRVGLGGTSWLAQPLQAPQALAGDSLAWPCWRFSSLPRRRMLAQPAR